MQQKSRFLWLSLSLPRDQSSPVLPSSTVKIFRVEETKTVSHSQKLLLHARVYLLTANRKPERSAGAARLQRMALSLRFNAFQMSSRSGNPALTLPSLWGARKTVRHAPQPFSLFSKVFWSSRDAWQH